MTLGVEKWVFGMAKEPEIGGCQRRTYQGDTSIPLALTPQSMDGVKHHLYIDHLYM